MGAYLLRRLLLIVPTLWAIITINFFIVQIAPGGPVDQAIAAGGDVRFAVMGVAFLAVAREGLEAALFLIAAGSTEDGWAVVVGGAITRPLEIAARFMAAVSDLHA